MTKKRELKSNLDAVCALRFIKDFKLSADQIAYRYSVDNLDKMCYELGLPPIDGELEAQKIFRILKALYPCNFSVLFQDKEKNKQLDQTEIGKRQVAQQQMDAKGKCWSC